MDKPDLEQIFIRAYVNDRWGTYSLQELLDLGQGGQIARWLRERIWAAVGLQEGGIVGEQEACAMVTFLEAIGITAFRLKADTESRADAGE